MILAFYFQEVMLDHRGVFWFDSSIRFTASNFQGLYDQLIANGGILTFTPTYHSNFQTTHHAMYIYLPMPAERAISTNQREASAIFVFRTKSIYENVVGWWFLCALEHDCMASSHKVIIALFLLQSRYSLECGIHCRSTLLILP